MSGHAVPIDILDQQGQAQLRKHGVLLQASADMHHMARVFDSVCMSKAQRQKARANAQSRLRSADVQHMNKQGESLLHRRQWER